MHNIFYYIASSIIIVALILLFVFKIRIGILLLFAIGVSFQYLEKVHFSILSGLDIAGIIIPFLIILGLVYSNKNIIYELGKDKIITYNLFILIPLLLAGVLFTGVVYPNHTFLNYFERIGAWTKFFNSFLVLLVVSAYFNDEKSINRLTNVMLLSLVIPGMIFFWQLMTGNLVANIDTGYPVPDAFFFHPDVYSYALIFHFPLCLFKYSQSTNVKAKLLWVFIILIFVVFIYFTYRRGVWMALFVQLFTYFIIMQKMKFRIIYGYIIILMIMALTFTPIAFTFQDRLIDIYTFFSNLQDMFNTTRYDNLFSGRWGIFRTNLLYVYREPIINFILGNGIGGTYYASDVMGGVRGGHNMYLILLIDFGFICLVGYLFFLFLVFFKLLDSLKSSTRFVYMYTKSLIALFVSYLVIGTLMHVINGNATNWLLWGLIGSLLGLLSNNKNASV